MSKSGRFLFLMTRSFWLVCAAFLWVFWLASVPRFLQKAAAGTLPTTLIDGLSPAQLATAGATSWGISVGSWAVVNTAVNGVSFFVFSLVALLIWWRVRTGYGLLTAFVLLLGGSNAMNNAIYSAELSATAVTLWELGAIIWPLFFLWLYLFPNGHAVPRRPLWAFVPLLTLFSLVFLLYMLTGFMEDGSPFTQIVAMLQPVFEFLIPPLFLLVIGAQVYRYLWLSGTAERKQTKWFLLGLIIFVLPTTLLSMVTDYPAELGTITFMALPIGIGISILRYRLWDIDLIIRKTVQYGVITAVLSLVYFGTIILLQSLVGQATGEQSPIIIVLSTLLIAGLFNPLRQRVQNFVDGRFFRKKYNAQQVLAQFAQTARDEVDMEALQAELLRVVQETLQPETVSIWLKK